jgi:flagellar biosynthesis/type III secretory pathway protein FliH
VFLKHWQEEQRMSQINYPPVQEAMSRIRTMSDDIEVWHEALRREMAIMDEQVLRREVQEARDARAAALVAGRAEGMAEGRAEGLAEGLAEGRAEGRAEGQAEGLARGTLSGQMRLLERLLTARFGPLDAATHDRLHNATLSELEEWAERLLHAPDLHSVLEG